MRYLFIISILLLMANPLSAIITSDNSVAETAPAGFDWSFVFNHPDGSCVAVAPTWILTASHVADYGGPGTLTLSGTNYLKKEIIYHDTADIALVRYDKEFPGHYDLYTDVSLLNSNVMMVGFGHTGTVTKVGKNYCHKRFRWRRDSQLLGAAVRHDDGSDRVGG